MLFLLSVCEEGSVVNLDSTNPQLYSVQIDGKEPTEGEDGTGSTPATVSDRLDVTVQEDKFEEPVTVMDVSVTVETAEDFILTVILYNDDVEVEVRADVF